LVFIVFSVVARPVGSSAPDAGNGPAKDPQAIPSNIDTGTQEYRMAANLELVGRCALLPTGSHFILVSAVGHCGRWQNHRTASIRPAERLKA
jgi:hypothetical protein